MKRVTLLLIAALLISTGGAWAQGKISGLMYGDYFYNVARDTAFARTALPNSALSGEKSYQAFQFRRIFFTYDHDISELFTARFRVEADQISNTTDGKIGVAVKDAFLRWKNIFQGSDLVFGLQPTPEIDIVEAAWGFRSLEKTIVDLRGIAFARDLGIALRGKTDTSGVFSYWVQIGNGNNNKPENDKYKRYYAAALWKPIKPLQIMAYGDFNARANKNDQFSTTVPRTTVSNSVLTYDAMVALVEPDRYSVGVETFMQQTMNDFVPPAGKAYQHRNTIGLSVWATYNFRPELGLVGRFDYFDPNSESGYNDAYKGDARNYFLGAFVWRPAKNVSLMPNVQVETYEALPKSAAYPNGLTYDTSVTARVTFAYIFQ